MERVDKSCEIWVGTFENTIYLRIDGRATHLYAVALKVYLHEAIKQGCKQLKIELGRCISMDSTFLGVLAVAAVKLNGEENAAAGTTLFHVPARILGAISGLGIDRILNVVQVGSKAPPIEMQLLPESGIEMREWASTIIETHEFLGGYSTEEAPFVESVVTLMKDDVGRHERFS
jgi:hypothetical protein